MKRVFIFSNWTLFADAIASLLSPQPGLDVLGWETDPARALRRVGRIRPDVVIVTGSEPGSGPAPIVAEILQACPGTRVIEASTEANVLHVHGEGLQLVSDLKDLLDAIEQASTGGEPRRLPTS